MSPARSGAYALVVGAGLAGACVAQRLARRGPVVVLDAEGVAAGASGAAAGLANPFLGPKANPTWRHAEALDALDEALADAGAALRTDGLLRPARDPRQAQAFRARAAEHPHRLAWLDAETLAERYPSLVAPHGGLDVRAGGAVDLPSFVTALLGTPGVGLAPGVRAVGFGEDEKRAWIETPQGDRLEAEVVVLALGAAFGGLRATAALPLHRVKGQTIRVLDPGGLANLPALSGHGYVVPDGGTFVLGATYEHDFTDDAPTAEATASILRQAARMVPELVGAVVVETRAGVRATVPRSASPKRLPLVGPLPGSRRVWGVLGLGSKGLMTAPLIARHLPGWIHRPETIPAEVRLGRVAANGTAS